jgi:hypothetical protein
MHKRQNTARTGAGTADIDPDDLGPWIVALRGRLARGELVALPQVRLSPEVRADAALIAQVMLDELDEIGGLPPAENDRLDVIVRRRSLLRDLCWHRQQIG